MLLTRQDKEYVILRTLTLATAVTIALTGITPVGQPTHTATTDEAEVPILTGQLVAPDGPSSALAHQPVHVFAWPSNDELGSLELNEQFDLIPIASAETDANGEFDIQSSPSVSAALDAAAEGDEFVNVSVQSVTPAGAYAHSATVPASPTDTEMAAAFSALDSSDAIAVELGAIEPMDTTVTAAQVESFADAAEKAMAVQGQADEEYVDDQYVANINPPVYRNGFCSGSSYQRNPSRPMQVGGTFVHVSGPTSTYQFRAEGTATVGTATSASGAFGSFSAGGTTTVRNSAVASFAPNTWGSKFHRVNVDSAMYRITCVTPDGVPYNSWRELRPYGLPGGVSTVAGTTFTTLAHCQPLEVKARVELDRSKSTAWSTGFKAGSLIGLDLSSQSGFTTESKMVFTGGSTKTRYCGLYSSPGYTPGRVKISAP